MVRQRTKRWGFDLGGEYITGIAKQELIEKEKARRRNLLEKTRPIPLRRVKKFKNAEDALTVINPIR